MKIIKRALDDLFSAQSQGFKRGSIFPVEKEEESPISLEYVNLPTGAESIPHAHINTHTVVYTLSGSVKIYYGDALENQLIVGPKDSVYIPPNVIHHVVNEWQEDMLAVVARSPAKNEVIEYPELINKKEKIWSLQ